MVLRKSPAPAHFRVLGKPHGKERPRLFGNHVGNTREQRAEEDKVFWSYLAAGYEPLEYNLPVRLVVTAHYLPPKKLPEEQQSWLIGRPAYCHNASHPIPDIDNVLKHVSDALTGSGTPGRSGGAWCDDTMIVEIVGASFFDEHEYIEVEIIPLDLDDPYGFYELRAIREAELETEREAKKRGAHRADTEKSREKSVVSDDPSTTDKDRQADAVPVGRE